MTEKLGGKNVTIDKDGTVRVYGPDAGGEKQQPPKSDFDKVMEQSIWADLWMFSKAEIFFFCLTLAIAAMHYNTPPAMWGWIGCAAGWMGLSMAGARIGTLKMINGEILRENMMMGMHLATLRAVAEAVMREKGNG